MTNSRRSESALAVRQDGASAVASSVLRKYGNVEMFQKTWNWEKMAVVSDRIETSVQAGVPPFVGFIKAYGKEAVENNLFGIIQRFLVEHGEQRMTSDDIRQVAHAMIGCMDARTVNYAFVLNFFSELSQGKWDFYPTPRKLMVSFQAYIKSARERQRALELEQETARRNKEAEERRRNAISFEEYKRRRGIDACVSNPIEQIQKEL